LSQKLLSRRTRLCTVDAEASLVVKVREVSALEDPVEFVKIPVKSIKKFYVNEDREEWKLDTLGDL
jgi:hypothetical protein